MGFLQTLSRENIAFKLLSAILLGNAHTILCKCVEGAILLELIFADTTLQFASVFQMGMWYLAGFKRLYLPSRSILD